MVVILKKMEWRLCGGSCLKTTVGNQGQDFQFKTGLIAWNRPGIRAKNDVEPRREQK